jgi:hypothetical protein
VENGEVSWKVMVSELKMWTFPYDYSVSTRGTGNPDCFCDFSQSLQMNAGMVPQTTTTSFQILFISSFINLVI